MLAHETDKLACKIMAIAERTTFAPFPCKYWFVTSMKIEPVVIIIIRIKYSIQKMFKIHLPKAINMILEVFTIFFMNDNVWISIDIAACYPHIS